MLKDKAIIIIAVSKYAGAYHNLPGAVISAKRLREWAEQPDEDCNYKVLYLADDVFEKIDVQLVSEKVSEFVSNNFIDRLVVYFAGHGIVRSAGDQFWLLTNAANDLREGINVEGFRRGLLKCNIGTHNDKLPGQLCIISDACRNTSRDAIDFSGDPILTSTARMNKGIQLDRFLSTGLGDYSFQIDEADGSAYCLFSEVLLNALCGEVQEAIETEHHQFKPVVTNHKLAEYLQEEVRKRAAAIEEEMEPDLLTGIHPPYNFYKRFRKPLAAPNVMLGSQEPQLAAAIQMAIHEPHKKGSDDQLSTKQEHRRQILLKARQCIERVFQESYSSKRLRHDSLDFPIICDFLPNCIAAPRSAVVQVRPREKFYEIISSNFKGAPILIPQDNQWILAPHYPNVVPIVLRDLPGDILFYKPYLYHYPNLSSRNEYWDTEHWDTYLSDFSNLVRSSPLRAADANKFADKIRVGKEEYPHQSVTAGYLYEFSNDYDNIARTAHYMAETGVVPFDLALLCADKIWWLKEKDRFVAFADLPTVERSQTIENEGERPYYARSEFQALKEVRLWGIAPIFSQGWNFMQTERYLKIPERIQLIAEKTSGRSTASLTKKGLEMFLEAFDYRVIETNKLITAN